MTDNKNTEKETKKEKTQGETKQFVQRYYGSALKRLANSLFPEYPVYWVKSSLSDEKRYSIAEAKETIRKKIGR